MKTLFCDLDNTLLFPLENGKYGIKDNDLSALKKALKEDLTLVISSGRPANINEVISEMLGCPVDAVGYNGHEMISKDQHVIFASFPVEDYLDITKTITDSYPFLSAATSDFNGIYYVNDIHKPEPLARFHYHKKAGIIKEVCELPAKEGFQKLNVSEVGKVLVRVPEDFDSEELISQLDSKYGDKYGFIRTNIMFIEGLCKGHTKRSGIESYIRMNNLDIKDCYCAGDADNDIEMFELLKENSFCMKAGTEKARNTAAFLVEDLAEAIKIIKDC